MAALLLISVGILGFFVYSQSTAIREQGRQVRELAAKVESKSKNNSLELQEKCAKQARETFKLAGWDSGQMAGFTNHYNEKLNKCFIAVEHTSTSKTPRGTYSISKILSDAFEGKSYAEYMWQSDKVKKSWENPPFLCEATLPSGEHKFCHSSEEFEALLKPYMEQ